MDLWFGQLTSILNVGKVCNEIQSILRVCTDCDTILFTEYVETCQPAYGGGDVLLATYSEGESLKTGDDCQTIPVNNCRNVAKPNCRKIADEQCRKVPNRECGRVPVKECRQVSRR